MCCAGGALATSLGETPCATRFLGILSRRRSSEYAYHAMLGAMWGSRASSGGRDGYKTRLSGCWAAAATFTTEKIIDIRLTPPSWASGECEKRVGPVLLRGDG